MPTFSSLIFKDKTVPLKSVWMEVQAVEEKTLFFTKNCDFYMTQASCENGHTERRTDYSVSKTMQEARDILNAYEKERLANRVDKTDIYDGSPPVQIPHFSFMAAHL